MKIAVYGGPEFTVGFQLAGVRECILPTDKLFDDLEKIKERDDISIVITDEKILDELDQVERAEIENSVEPVFIPVSTKVEQDSLKRLIKRSIGVDLWK